MQCLEPLASVVVHGSLINKKNKFQCFKKKKQNLMLKRKNKNQNYTFQYSSEYLIDNFVDVIFLTTNTVR